MNALTRRAEAIGIAAVIAVLALSGWAIYHAGVQRGQVNEKLKVNAAAIAATNAQARADSVKEAALRKSADSALTAAAHADTARVIARAKVTVTGNTVSVPSEGVSFFSPAIANLVRTSDVSAAASQFAIVKVNLDADAKDSRIRDLTLGIKQRDDRIHLLEGEKRPRFTKGLQLGAGYCLAGDGRRTPCAYVGIGVEIRI